MFIHHDSVTTIAFTNDDRRIISSSEDGLLYEWEIGGSPLHKKEFFVRNAICPLVVISFEGTILTYFEDSTTLQKFGSGGRRSFKTHLGSTSSDTKKLDRKICLFTCSVQLVADECIDVEQTVTAMVSCYIKQPSPEFGKQEMIAIGFIDGKILICQFPIPIRILEERSWSLRKSMSVSASFRVSGDSSDASGLDSRDIASTEPALAVTAVSRMIDEAACRLIHLHTGPVLCLAASECGNWIFSGGSDASLLMFATNYRSLNMNFNRESGHVESSLIITDLEDLKDIQHQAKHSRAEINDLMLESAKNIDQITTEKDQIITRLQTELTREVSRRDKIIITERDAHLKTMAELHQEINEAKSKELKSVSIVEHDYETKLAEESLYLFQSKFYPYYALECMFMFRFLGLYNVQTN